MQFLVTGEWVEVGALLPPQQLVPVMDGAVLPSLETFVQWEREGRIHGGILAGQRAGAFVLEAASAEEAGDLLSSLPFWGLVKWQVTALQSFASTAARDRAATERARQHP
jgi:hypothetical protein